MNRLLFLFLSFILLTACKKKVQEVPILLSVNNKYDAALNYKFYSSKEDFMNDENVIAVKRIERGATGIVDVSVAHESGNLFCDIYSDDYSLTNWTMNTISTSMVEAIKSGRINDTVKYVGICRKYYIDGNKRETNWKVIDLLNSDAASIWNPNNVYSTYKITLQKDGNYILTTGFANAVQQQYGYFIAFGNDENATMSIEPGMFIGRTHPTPHPHATSPMISDTAIFAGKAINAYLVVVKEQ